MIQFVRNVWNRMRRKEMKKKMVMMNKMMRGRS